ncbi:MAG: hypothetical protein F6K36_30150 [Symploca sp. SIO3C6]|nr:hypothetical protein [Symploca sp. SIO3C6]
MSETVIATRKTITIGPLSVDGFMLPDGSYRMSQTQTAEAIGLNEINARRFLGSKSIKGLLGKGYTPDTLAVEKTDDSKRGGTRINALPLEVVSAFWLQQCTKGNKKAIALTMALLTETLERRFDNAFGVDRTEDDYNATLFKRVESLETDVGEAYTVADDMAREVSELRRYIKEQGLPGPYSLEDGE